jgi:inosine-uridine nucleoside N-ribohydrolase
LRPIILDADLNYPSDDFQALLLVLASEMFQVLGCCAVAGNTWMEEVWINTRAALHLIGALEIPLAKGRSWAEIQSRREWALARCASRTNPFVGAYEKSATPRLETSALQELEATVPEAKELLVRTVLAYPNSLEVLCTGPLTNLATVLAADPTLASQFRRITIMGGHFGPLAEADRPDFNMWFDAEAASVVFGSGAPIRLIPLEVCRSARCSIELVADICCVRGGWADVFGSDFLGMAAQHGNDMALCDQLAALVCIDESLIVTESLGRVDADTSWGLHHGKTRFRPDSTGNVQLVTAVDRFRAHASLRKLVSVMAGKHADPFTPSWLRRIL